MKTDLLNGWRKAKELSSWYSCVRYSPNAQHYTAGKVIISMIQAFGGRVYSSGKNVTPSLVLHIDEAQSVLYNGIEDLFAKAGGAGVYIHGYCQSISQLYSEIGEDRANTILDNCNTKLFMRVPDAKRQAMFPGTWGKNGVFRPSSQSAVDYRFERRKKCASNIPRFSIWRLARFF